MQPDQVEQLSAGTFSERAWLMITRVPAGRVTTYGDVAAALGSPKASRAVGMAMGRNPHAPDVPCHRVVGHDGKLTGFGGGLPKKQRMLREEGVPVEAGRVPLRARPGLRVRAHELVRLEPADGRVRLPANAALDARLGEETR
jgi:O-6-methylguanine DNA methyltransferase